MTAPPITIEGTLQPDGVTLRLDRKVALPPGRVTLTVQPSESRSGPTMLEVLDRIHRDQQQRGRRPITEEEMAAEIAQMRADDEEYEERWRQIGSQTGTQGQDGE
jgi:hypothetical protein